MLIHQGHAYGSIDKHTKVFSGQIHLGEDVYYIEEADKYFGNDTGDVISVLYRLRDVVNQHVAHGK